MSPKGKRGSMNLKIPWIPAYAGMTGIEWE
jgi:hypothetical protein